MLIEFTKEHKELLTRLAKGISINIIGIELPEEANTVIAKIDALKVSTNQNDVLKPIKSLFSNYINNDVSYDKYSDVELIEILKQGQYKHKVIVANQKLSKQILQNMNNQTYDWKVLLEETAQYLGDIKTLSNGFVSISNINWDDNTHVVCSWGYPVLDALIDNGIAHSSYTVLYGSAGVGKSTVVTRQIACSVLKEGKKPLIISLEGDPNKTAKRILLQMAGMSMMDVKDIDFDTRKKLQKIQAKLPDIPIINCNASKKFEMDRLVRIYKPDVIIYDQLTIGAKSRDWNDMASVSHMLKTLALETGIPVVAITQSDRRYSNLIEEDDDEKDEDIKYAQAIREDATTIIKITKQFGNQKHGRILTIEKTKDDSLAPRLPIKIKVSLGNSGMVEEGVTEDKNTIPASSFLLAERRSIVNVNMEIVEKIAETTQEVLYNTDTYLLTGERLKSVANTLQSKDLLDLSETWNNHTKKDDTYNNLFLRSWKYESSDVNRAYGRYYHND